MDLVCSFEVLRLSCGFLDGFGEDFEWIAGIYDEDGEYYGLD